MYSLNIPADSSKGFKSGMSWSDIISMMDKLCEVEKKTSFNKNLLLYYTANSFFDR